MAKECQFENCCNPVFSHGYCKYHQHKRTDKKAPKQKIEFQGSKTGEGVFLVTYLNTHPNIDFITKEPIDDATVYNCHHVLPKSHYGLWRLNDKNIVLLSSENHNLVHTRAESDLTNPDKNENWQGWLRYFALFKKLKDDYESI